jgi:hypothetical protein
MDVFSKKTFGEHRRQQETKRGGAELPLSPNFGLFLFLLRSLCFSSLVENEVHEYSGKFSFRPLPPTAVPGFAGIGLCVLSG